MSLASSFDRLKVVTFKELRSDLLWAYDDEVAVTNLSSDMSPVQTIAWLIRSGGVLIRQGSEVVTAAPRTWIFPAMMMGWQEFKPGTKLLSIRFTARWLDNRRSLFDHRRAVVIPSADAPALERAGSELAKAVWAYAGDVAHGGSPMPDLYSKAIDVGAHFEIQARFADWLSAYANAMQKVGGMKPGTATGAQCPCDRGDAVGRGLSAVQTPARGGHRAANRHKRQSDESVVPALF